MRFKQVMAAVAIAAFSLPMATSSSAVEPATWAKIASAVASYMQSQEGQCQVHAINCDGGNQGAKNRCHEIVRRLKEFTRNPNDYNAKQVYDITGSRRTVCMAKRIVGDNAWAQFDSHRR
jgi:hypothetical protein